MSEKDYKSVDIAVEISSSLEVSALYTLFKEHGWSYQQDRGGPLLTVGKLVDRPICVAPLIHVIEGVRVLYVEATSGLVDWNIIEEWVRSVTGKDNIRIQNEPNNLFGDIQAILWRREQGIPTASL